MIEEAFFQVCRDAKPAVRNYVSLYVDVPFYGGPEEGGWWGSDTVLIAYRPCNSEEEAEAIYAQVKELAAKLSEEAKREHGRHCAAQCEWLESRGLDSDFLPEVDGESRYWVSVDETPGEYAARGDRMYS